MEPIQNLINSETLNIIYIVLAIGVGWIVLRFVLKLAGTIFKLGCLAIVVIGALLVIAQMLYLESEDPDKEIFFYLNTPGGVVSAGLAIYDTMQYIKPAVCTVCMGQAASMGAILLAAGERGKRYALPNSRIVIHQPLGGSQGQATDIAIQAKEILRLKGALNEILANHTKQSIEKVEKDADRDYYMTSQEAKDYGIVDEVIIKRELLNLEKGALP